MTDDQVNSKLRALRKAVGLSPDKGKADKKTNEERSRFNLNEERTNFSSSARILVICILSGDVVVIFLHGFKICNFELPTGALITLLGTTTACVFGLYYIVGKYLFHVNSESDKN